jgi:hypothetical protein
VSYKDTPLGAIVHNGFDENTLKHQQEHTLPTIGTLISQLDSS